MSNEVCRIAGCNRLVVVRGMCRLPYQKWWSQKIGLRHNLRPFLFIKMWYKLKDYGLLNPLQLSIAFPHYPSSSLNFPNFPLPMLSINDLRVGTIFLWKNQPYKVLEAKHIFMGRGSSTLQAKIKNLITGNVLSQSFKPSDSFEETEISRREIKYLYNHRGQFWFSEKNNPAKRFFLEENIIGTQAKFLKSKSLVKAVILENKIINIELPIKMDFKVKIAPPGDKKDAAQRSTKIITLENGTQIKAPLFINSGDIVRVNTETGEYVERVNKA